MTILHFHGQFLDTDVYLQVGKYGNGRIAIQALDTKDDMPAFTLTVNIPDEQINDDEVFIKDYAENQGVLAFARENGIVYDLIRFAKCGYADVPLCKLDIKRLKALV